MKTIFALLFLFWYVVPITNNTYFATNNGTVSFFSKTPVEDISAKQSTAQSVINTTSQQIAVQLTVKDFTFPNALMQEHFNENYMETEKYPQATFSGKINEKIDFSKVGSYPVTATGKLKLHGVEKERTLTGTLQVAENQLVLDCAFDVALKDHNIDVPKLVFVKIAQIIQVKAHFEYAPKK